MSLICASAMLLVPASSALAQHNADAAAAAESSTSTVSNLATMATVTASGREVSSGFGPELAADNQDLPDNPTDKSVHNASGASRWSADRGSGLVAGLRIPRRSDDFQCEHRLGQHLCDELLHPDFR